MSNERGEMAQMLLAAIKETPHIWIDSELGPKEVTIDGAVDLTAVAAELIAAGYRKPRTISTREEVDALPNGAVVMTEFGDASTIYADVRESHANHYYYLVDGITSTVLLESAS